MVSPEPDIFSIERNPADEFILIACDGVFDVLSDEDACFHVRQVQRARASILRPPLPPPSLVVDAPLSVGRISRRSSAARAASLNSRRSTKNSSTSACASSRATTCRRSSRSSRPRGRQAPSAVAHLAERAPLTYAALPPRRAATDEDTRERAIHYRVETRRCNTLARGRRLRRGRIGPRLVC